MKRVAGLDVLRGIAILLVMLRHPRRTLFIKPVTHGGLQLVVVACCSVSIDALASTDFPDGQKANRTAIRHRPGLGTEHGPIQSAATDASATHQHALVEATNLTCCRTTSSMPVAWFITHVRDNDAVNANVPTAQDW